MLLLLFLSLLVQGYCQSSIKPTKDEYNANKETTVTITFTVTKAPGSGIVSVLVSNTEIAVEFGSSFKDFGKYHFNGRLTADKEGNLYRLHIRNLEYQDTCNITIKLDDLEKNILLRVTGILEFKNISKTWSFDSDADNKQFNITIEGYPQIELYSTINNQPLTDYANIRYELINYYTRQYSVNFQPNGAPYASKLNGENLTLRATGRENHQVSETIQLNITWGPTFHSTTNDLSIGINETSISFNVSGNPQPDVEVITPNGTVLIVATEKHQNQRDLYTSEIELGSLYETLQCGDQLEIKAKGLYKRIVTQDITVYIPITTTLNASNSTWSIDSQYGPKTYNIILNAYPEPDLKWILSRNEQLLTDFAIIQAKHLRKRCQYAFSVDFELTEDLGKLNGELLNVTRSESALSNVRANESDLLLTTINLNISWGPTVHTLWNCLNIEMDETCLSFNVSGNPQPDVEVITPNGTVLNVSTEKKNQRDLYTSEIELGSLYQSLQSGDRLEIKAGGLYKRLATQYITIYKPSKAGMVRKVVAITNSDGSVTLTWEAPFSLGGSDVIYVVELGGNKLRTMENTITIPTGTQDKTYNVQIYAEVRYCNEVYVGEIHNSKILVKGEMPLTLVVGVAIGVILFTVVVLLAGFCVWRKRRPPSQVVRMEDGTVKLPNNRLMNAGRLHVVPTTYNNVDDGKLPNNAYVNASCFIHPSIYDDVIDAVQEFAYELDRNDLKIHQFLGHGEFAEVYKGELFKNGEQKQVAVKTLKTGASDKDRLDFLGEASILGQFNDTNVISLEGVIFKDDPNVIALEFMSNGSLLNYLQDNDNKFTVLQLLGMARGVASGMKYLSELGFIHRDIAARNILVDEHNICKVSDFGMSRELVTDDTYESQGGKIPIRWTAPEAIQFKEFTASSDVWSYGVLLWEIVSYGKRPYGYWSNFEVREKVRLGYRLPCPQSVNCPKVVHDLMLCCWRKDRTRRPTFGEIRDQLENWIQNPDLLQEIASLFPNTYEVPDDTEILQKWLEAIGMSKYTNNFLDRGFVTQRQILTLDIEDLEALGIGHIGHRKKIYQAIQNTKIQAEASNNASMSDRRTITSTSYYNV